MPSTTSPGMPYAGARSAAWPGHRRDVGDRRVLHVQVVLADEQHRQLPYGGQVQGLVEGADVGGSVPEEGDRELSGPAEFRRPGGADRHREVGADDGVGAEHERVGLGEVHRAALGPAQPRGPLHEFGEALLRGGTPGHGVVVAAVGGEDVVVVAQGGARADGDRLVACGEMGGALDEALEEQVVGSLLGAADEGHLLVAGEEFSGVHRRSRCSVGARSRSGCSGGTAPPGRC